MQLVYRSVKAPVILFTPDPLKGTHTLLTSLSYSYQTWSRGCWGSKGAPSKSVTTWVSEAKAA